MYDIFREKFRKCLFMSIEQVRQPQRPSLSTMSKQGRKNSPTCTAAPSTWPDAVWEAFETRLSTNRTSKNTTYLQEAVVPNDNDLPPALQRERCLVPTGSNMIMVVVNGRQYQRPLHRMKLLLHLRSAGIADALDIAEQASHLCMDAVNVDGKGSKHCANPLHMVVEDDRTNKKRQRCAGWVWIHPYQDRLGGGYWYPTCIHDPPCLRYTPKALMPTLLRN